MDRFALGQGLLAFGGRQQLAAQNEAIRQNQFAAQRNALAAQQEGVQKRIESAFGFYRDAPPDVQEKIAPLLSKWAVGNGADPVWVQSALSPKAFTDKLPTKASIAMQAAGQDPMKALELMKETSGGAGDFGSSMDGRSYAVLLDIKKRRDNGQPISQELLDRGIAASHILTQPRIVVGSNGERYEYTPGIPSELQIIGTPRQQVSSAQEKTLVSDVDDEIQAQKEDTFTTPGGAKLSKLTEKEDDLAQKRLQAIDQINVVLDLLDDASKKGWKGQITGAIGKAKAVGGGAARQIGIPVGPEAKNLDRALETLATIMTPIIMGETKLSNDERQRVREIVGTVNALDDEVDIRNAISEIVRIIELGM